MAILTVFSDLPHKNIHNSLVFGHILTNELSSVRELHWLGNPANINEIFLSPLVLWGVQELSSAKTGDCMKEVII